MRQDYSRTAEAMALVRAIEQARPAASRIIDDPYAAAFLQNRYYRWLARTRAGARLLRSFLDRWAPGGQEFLTIRPRLVDDLAAELAGAGLEQIVVLGAGFDTMPWRLGGAPLRVTVYEVDHPATQAVKRAGAERLGAPPNLRLVAADFEREDFAKKLREVGFAPARRSLVVWLGVSYYLTPAAAGRALDQIAGLGGAGTRLVWDYLLAEVAAGTSADRDALGKARRAARLGEPWLFGLEPAGLGDYLAAHGFRLLRDYDADELRARYAPTRRRPLDYVRLVDCERE